MVLGKRVAIFNWEWGRNSAPREGQKMPLGNQSVTTKNGSLESVSMVFTIV